jgi:hypothetical protein
VANGAVEGLVELLKECNNHIPAAGSAKLATGGHNKLFAGAARGERSSSSSAAHEKDGALIGRQRISSPGGISASCGFSNHEPCEYCGWVEGQLLLLPASGAPCLLPPIGSHDDEGPVAAGVAPVAACPLRADACPPPLPPFPCK